MNYFDPRVLAGVKNLYLRARLLVDGVMVGIHPSQAKGLSSEFEEHRGYAQGDDTRRIDWKTYAKFDRYYIKEYRKTTNLKAHLLLDCSASMGYGSDGISNNSLVNTVEELEERAAHIHARFNQAAIAEEYIDGREVYIGIIGTRRLRVLPPRELFFGRSDEGGPVLATYKLKWDEDYQKRWKVQFGNGELDEQLLKAASRISRRAYRALQIRDYGRVDLRIAPDGRMYVLEVNPNPNLAQDDELGEAAKAAGIPYTKLVEWVLRSALRRGKKR